MSLKKWKHKTTYHNYNNIDYIGMGYFRSKLYVITNVW